MRSFLLHKQFKAFTLLELLVGMILSGIVLTATFTAYKIVTRQYQGYNVRSESISELSFFVSQLQSDFSNATTIIRISENEIQLQSEKRVLQYRFSEKRVLRNDFSRIDTFDVSVPKMETFFKSEKENSENSQIDKLSLELSVEGKRVEKVLQKINNAKSEIDRIETELDDNLWQ